MAEGKGRKRKAERERRLTHLAPAVAERLRHLGSLDRLPEDRPQ